MRACNPVLADLLIPVLDRRPGDTMSDVFTSGGATRRILLPRAVERRKINLLRMWRQVRADGRREVVDRRVRQVLPPQGQRNELDAHWAVIV